MDIRTITGSAVGRRMPAWQAFAAELGIASPSRDPAWLTVLAEGLKHPSYCLEAAEGEQLLGLLPLSLVRSLWFGRFLVSLPYLNVGGILAADSSVAAALIERAARLADELNVRYLELRHEAPVEHSVLAHQLVSKVHMRLPLPASADELWDSFSPKVRNQVRKAEKQELSVQWGRAELLSDFYGVFARNMRDLGTPVFAPRLFSSILRQFADSAELCVVRLGRRPVAAGLLMHGRGVSEVPSASSLRAYNATNANMLMYWHFLRRAIERGQSVFDFGRSSPESSTFRFKKQWGAQPAAAVWQYYLRKGSVGDMRLESGKYRRWVAVWRWLPVPLTRLLGPPIVRGIP